MFSKSLFNLADATPLARAVLYRFRIWKWACIAVRPVKDVYDFVADQVLTLLDD